MSEVNGMKGDQGQSRKSADKSREGNKGRMRVCILPFDQ